MRSYATLLYIIPGAALVLGAMHLVRRQELRKKPATRELPQAPALPAVAEPQAAPTAALPPPSNVIPIRAKGIRFNHRGTQPRTAAPRAAR